LIPFNWRDGHESAGSDARVFCLLDRFPIMLKQGRVKYRSKIKHLSGSFTIRLSKADRAPLWKASPLVADGLLA
jgi:hypothetical protein